MAKLYKETMEREGTMQRVARVQGDHPLATVVIDTRTFSLLAVSDGVGRVFGERKKTGSTKAVIVGAPEAARLTFIGYRAF